jgi:hypothetical protein
MLGAAEPQNAVACRLYERQGGKIAGTWAILSMLSLVAVAKAITGYPLSPQYRMIPTCL